MKKRILYLIFVLIVLGELTAAFTGIMTLDYFFKPLIMIWIGGFFLLNARRVGLRVRRFAVAAFFFSWTGDMLLMFSTKDFLFFMLGLVSFLMAHIFYILLFTRTIRVTGNDGYLKNHPFWLATYLVYGLILYVVLFPRLDAVLRIAVFIYLTAILSMSAMAFHRKGAVPLRSFRWVFTGSLFFIISDSLIALNKFLIPISQERVLVMSTYILAQYLIMRGILIQFEK